MTSTNKTTNPKRSIIESLANQLDCDPVKLVSLLKATAFSACRSSEEFMAACMVANIHQLNPVLGEVYAFVSKSGAVIPIVSIDGWVKIINRHPALDGIEFEDGDDYSTATIFLKDRGHPTRVTEWLSECRGTTAPWTRWPRRMLRHKALIQCARIAFGLSGIVDPDEAQRIDESASMTVAMLDKPRSVSAGELIAAQDHPAPALPAPSGSDVKLPKPRRTRRAKASEANMVKDIPDPALVAVPTGRTMEAPSDVGNDFLEGFE